MSTAELIFYAHKAGLTLSDFEVMTVGMIYDVIAVYCNYQRQLYSEIGNDKGKSKDGGEDTIRDATQEDFDRFARMY